MKDLLTTLCLALFLSAVPACSVGFEEGEQPILHTTDTDATGGDVAQNDSANQDTTSQDTNGADTTNQDTNGTDAAPDVTLDLTPLEGAVELYTLPTEVCDMSPMERFHDNGDGTFHDNLLDIDCRNTPAEVEENGTKKKVTLCLPWNEGVNKKTPCGTYAAHQVRLEADNTVKLPKFLITYIQDGVAQEAYSLRKPPIGSLSLDAKGQIQIYCPNYKKMLTAEPGYTFLIQGGQSAANTLASFTFKDANTGAETQCKNTGLSLFSVLIQ